jgi:hypothetical protein
MRQLCESIRAREARIVSRNVDWEILRLNSERARPTHKKKLARRRRGERRRRGAPEDRRN